MTKILIVDDTPHRYQDLLTKLAQIGVERTSVKMITCANDALDEIKKNRYDLLVLDILLPNWPEGDPDQQHSLDLLFAIKNDPDVLKPKWIIGITADAKVANNVLPDFEQHTWTIVSYSPVSEEWMSKIFNCVKYLQDKQQSIEPVEYIYDLVVICALPTPELEEVIRLPWSWSAPKPLDDTTFFREGSFTIDGKKYRVAAVHSARMGMVSSAVVATKVIHHLRPKCIIMSGICAGHKSKAKLGDVLIADPAWDFQSGKLTSVNGHAKMEFSPHQIPISASIRSRIEQIASDHRLIGDIAADFGSDAPNGFRLRIGPVASGGAVLADGKVIDEIRHLQNRDLLGLEMEIYGVYAAAQQASEPKPSFVAIKEVCDYADPQKHDGAQRFASFASAQVLRRLVEKYAADLFAC